MMAKRNRYFESSDEAFAVMLREARERKSMTQEELATFMARAGHDFHQQTIYKIESGRRKVTVGEAITLAEAVDVPIETLTNRSPDSPGSLALEVRRTGREYAEFLFELASTVGFGNALRQGYVRAVREYAQAPTAYVDAPNGDKVPITEVFESLALFAGLSDYRVAWRELMANPEARFVLKSVGWDPDEVDDDDFI